MTARLALVLVALMLAGCGEKQRRELAAFHHPTPETMQVRLTWHANAAEAMTAANAESRTVRNSFVAHLTGNSNGYNWREAYAVQVFTTADRLEVGQLIIFRGASGKNICHPIVSRDTGGWITAGTGNAQADFGRVTDANLVSRIVSVHSWPQ